jgi:hypothetical protein
MTVDPIRRRTLFRLAIAGVMASGGLATTARAVGRCTCGANRAIERRAHRRHEARALRPV